MEPFDSNDERYRRIVSVLEPAPNYEATADATPAVAEDQEIDDLVVVSADGRWILELELQRQEHEIARAACQREIERAIDAVLEPEWSKRSV